MATDGVRAAELYSKKGFFINGLNNQFQGNFQWFYVRKHGGRLGSFILMLQGLRYV